MKFTSVFVSLVSASLACARPLYSSSPLQARNVSATTVGAAYWLTNEVTGNMVMSANILSDGRLQFAQAVPAGGRGSHGVTTPPNAPDALFSQGAIKVNTAMNMLVTINPGSNTVAMFSIDPTNPANITMIGQPVSSGGEFPMSIAINKNATMACSLNSGSVNGVQCFTMDMSLGMTAMPNTQRLLGLNTTTPPSGPAGTAGHVIFSADESKLIATVKGIPPAQGFIAVWDVLPDGTLSPSFTKSAPAMPGGLPFSATVIPGTNAILATDAAAGVDIFDLSTGNAATSSVLQIPGQGATCWSSHSPKTGNFYTTDLDTSTVTEVNVDQNLNATMVKQYPLTPGAGTIDNDILSIGDRDFLFTMMPNITSIEVMELIAPGQVNYIQTFDIAGAAAQAGIPVSASLSGMTSFAIPGAVMTA